MWSVSVTKLVDTFVMSNAMIDGKRIAQLHVFLADLGYVASAEFIIAICSALRSFIVMVNRNACPCKCILVIGSDAERDRRT